MVVESVFRGVACRCNPLRGFVVVVHSVVVVGVDVVLWVGWCLRLGCGEFFGTGFRVGRVNALVVALST